MLLLIVVEEEAKWPVRMELLFTNAYHAIHDHKLFEQSNLLCYSLGSSSSILASCENVTVVVWH